MFKNSFNDCRFLRIFFLKVQFSMFKHLWNFLMFSTIFASISYSECTFYAFHHFTAGSCHVIFPFCKSRPLGERRVNSQLQRTTIRMLNYTTLIISRENIWKGQRKKKTRVEKWDAIVLERGKWIFLCLNVCVCVLSLWMSVRVISPGVWWFFQRMVEEGPQKKPNKNERIIAICSAGAAHCREQVWVCVCLGWVKVVNGRRGMSSGRHSRWSEPVMI